jgi:uncharacterized RDD family membrane protein YckC
MAEGQNPYAPPLAEVKDAPQAEQALGGRGLRLVAVIIDGMLQFAAYWVVSLALPWSVFNTNPSVTQLLVGTVLGLGLFVVLQGFLLVTRGQTIAKMLLGLRIVRRDGSKVGAARMLGLRYGIGLVISVIPFIGFIYVLIDSLLIFRDSRQCLHDQIADTMVIKA